jgi:hypothetical protein
MEHPHEAPAWREPMAAANLMLGGGLALVAGWAWLVCEASHPGGALCGPTLAGLLISGILLAASGCVLSFEGAWSGRAAAVLETLALIPAALFIAGLVTAHAVGVALAASACWLMLFAEAALLNRG